MNQQKPFHILKAADEGAGLVVLAAAPAWLDKSGVMTVGYRPGDPPARHLQLDALRAAGAALTAVLPVTGGVLTEVGAPLDGASSLTHAVQIPDPLYSGHRLYLVQLADKMPADQAAAQAAGFEYDVGSVTFARTPPDGPVQ